MVDLQEEITSKLVQSGPGSCSGAPSEGLLISLSIRRGISI